MPAFSYDPALLATTPVYQVRFNLGDTESSLYFLQDAEIQYLLDTYGSDVGQASIYGCHAIIAKLARKVDESVGQVSKSLSQRVEHYRGLYAELVNKFGAPMPYAGGISEGDKQAQEDDNDRVKPFATKKLHDNTRPSNIRGGLGGPSDQS